MAKVKHKVLFLSGQWGDLGGLNKMIATVAELISKQYEVYVCSLDVCEPGQGYPLARDVKYIELSPSDLYNVSEVVSGLGIDVFVGSNNCDLPYLDMYGKLEKLGVKTIMWNHESFFLPFTQPALFKVAEYRRDAYTHASVAVWLTESSAVACAQYSRHIAVIGNCTQGGAVTENKSDSNKLNIVSVGRFDSLQKGIGYLLLMFAELLKLNTAATLTVVGKYNMAMAHSSGDDETVAQLMERLRIPKEKIKFIGETRSAETYLSKAFLNVMVSDTEGFGLTVLEAAEHGVPSVVFDGGGPADIILDGVSGIVVPYGDYRLMARRVADLFNDKDGVRVMRVGAEKMSTQYSRAAIGRKWMELIENIITDRQTPYVPEETAMKRAISTYERTLLRRVRNPEAPSMEAAASDGQTKVNGVKLFNRLLRREK